MNFTKWLLARFVKQVSPVIAIFWANLHNRLPLLPTSQQGDISKRCCKTDMNKLCRVLAWTLRDRGVSYRKEKQLFYPRLTSTEVTHSWQSTIRRQSGDLCNANSKTVFQALLHRLEEWLLEVRFSPSRLAQCLSLLSERLCSGLQAQAEEALRKLAIEIASTVLINQAHIVLVGIAQPVPRSKLSTLFQTTKLTDQTELAEAEQCGDWSTSTLRLTEKNQETEVINSD